MQLNQLISRILVWRGTQRGRNVLTFLIFVVIATAFWFMTVLNEDEQRGYSVPVEITNLPENVTLINSSPISISVIVRDKGRSLLKFDWGKRPALRLKFEDFATTDNRVVISQQTITNYVRNTFGQSSEILSIRPDSVVINYTSRPPETLPIALRLNIMTESKHVVSGNLDLSCDSVKVYSLHGLPAAIKAIETKEVSLRDLTETTTVEVPLEVPAGTLVVPSKITVTVPVQNLIKKSRTIPVTVNNVPDKYKMLTFPSSVEISYMVPMDMFGSDNTPPTAIADYKEIRHGDPPTVRISLMNIPDFYQGLTCKPEEVEIHLEEK